MKMLDLLKEEEEVNKRISNFWRTDCIYSKTTDYGKKHVFFSSIKIIDGVIHCDVSISVRVESKENYQSFNIDENLISSCGELIMDAIKYGLNRTDRGITYEDIRNTKISLEDLSINLFKSFFNLRNILPDVEWGKLKEWRTVDEIFSGEKPYEVDPDVLPSVDTNFVDDSQVEYDRYLHLYEAFEEGTINLVLTYDENGEKKYSLPEEGVNYSDGELHPMKYKFTRSSPPHIMVLFNIMKYDQNEKMIKPEFWTSIHLYSSDIKIDDSFDDPDYDRYPLRVLVIEYLKDKFKQFGLEVA